MMITQNRIKNVLTLVTALGFFAAFGGSLQGETLVYEPFDYTESEDFNSTIVGSGTGLAGIWTAANVLIDTDSLSYGALPVTGNKAEFVVNLNGYCQASLDPAALSGKLDDSDTLWFGVMCNAANTGTSNTIQFSLGGMTNGMGFVMDRTNSTTARLRAAYWSDGIKTLSTGSATFTVGTFTPRLVVGKISFGAIDTLEIYLPETDLELPESPAGTVSTALDQSALHTIRFNIINGNTIHVDEVRLGETYSDVIDLSHPMNPSPADGATVSAGTVDLSWKNLPAASDPNGPVWVDVWFGTDPKSDYTKVVEAGENTTTVQVDAPIAGTQPTTYYWQVDSYIYGSATGDPNEGDVWKFYARDLPPESVDVGDDLVTWSGKLIELDATVVDDGLSALSYVWSAEPPDGVVFSATDVEDPDVTITKVPYSRAKIVNAGFEDPHPNVTYEGDYTWAKPIPGWGYVGIWSGLWWIGSDPNSDGYGYMSIAPEGVQIAMGYNSTDYITDAGLAQVLTETLAADTIYTLTVEVGHNATYGMDGYKVQLLAGGSTEDNEKAITAGTLLAEDNGSLTIPVDTFATSTVVFDSTGVDEGLLGQNLQIRLLVPIPTEPAFADWAVDFDDVRLTADPPFPTFAGVSTVELTLAVTDAVASREDSMTIEMYDNPCAAAKGADPRAIDQADFDGNCITDLEDFAEIALTWLVDYTLTEAVVKP